jgi:ribosomal protein S27AE
MYVKTRLERDWLLGMLPDKKYIRAVAQGGELVHLPTLCPKCGESAVAARSVEELYGAIAGGLHAKCPKCGAVLGTPRWAPWNLSSGGKVFPGIV